MLKNLILRLYPGVNKEELKKFELLSLIFFLIIGAYWSLRLLKNTIFVKVAFPVELGWAKGAGLGFQPLAKKLSPIIVLVMVLIYSRLIDKFKKHQLFYIICTFYGVIFTLLTTILFIKDIYGMEVLGKLLGGLFTNDYNLASKYILAASGWIGYFVIESFGSLVVALFWSFTSSIVNTESAKSGYPFIISVAQIAAIIGSIPLFFSERIGSFWPILLVTSILVFLVIPLVAYFMRVIPPEQMIGNKLAAKTENQKEGFFKSFLSGIILILTKPYLLGVLVLSTFYEAIGQIIEYQMQKQAEVHPLFSGALGYGKFQSIYGMSINILSFLIAFLGTSQLIKKLGSRISLVIYPLSFLVALSIMLLAYLLGLADQIGKLLWVTFGIMVFVKGMGYAVGNATKEMMYIPTSKDVKFKAKGWIDTFGSRLAKMGGAQVTDAFKSNIHNLLLYGTMFGFGLNFIWILAAVYVGYKNSQLLKENKIIE